MRCEAFGEQPIELIWLKDKRKLAGAGSGNDLAGAAEYSIEQVQLGHGAESWLTIAAAGREDSALYTCVAANTHGHDETNVQLIVHEPPEVPSPPHTLEVAARSVKLGWQPPFNGNSPILGYVLEYRSILDTTDAGELSANSLSAPDWHNITIRNGDCVAQVGTLVPATEYEFRLMAQNRLGFSDPGAVLRMRTEEEAPGTAPTGIRLAALSTKSVRVTWNPPERKMQNGRLRGYYVGYRLVGGVGAAGGLSNEQSQFVYKTVEAGAHANTAHAPSNFPSSNSNTNSALMPGQEETVITNLRRNSKYAFVVQAYNEKGAGPMSDEQQVITAELDPPDTPTLRVQSTTSGSVQLAWQSVASDQNPVDGYLLYQRQESSSEWREYSLDAQQTFYTAIGLHCGTRYQFYLVAFNKQGRGEQSELINVKTDGALPVAPDKKSALWVNSTLASVRLDAWHHGGCPITAFRVRYRAQSTKQWIQVWPPLPESMLDSNTAIGSGSLNDLNEIGSIPSVSSAQSSAAGDGSYNERAPSESPLIAMSPTQLEEQRLQLRDLHPGRKYIVQVTASNQVGSTDAEYSFSTFPIMSNELIRSSTKLISGSSLLIPSGNQLLQLGFLLPVTLCCAALLLLLLLLGALIRKQPALSGPAGNGNGSSGPGTLLYATSGHKEELQLANFTSKQAMAGVGCDANSLSCAYGFTTGTAAGRLGTLLGGDTLVKCDAATGAANAARLAASGAKVQLMEPLYATVKRTARLARTGNDTHIYSYPVGAATNGVVNNHSIMQQHLQSNLCAASSNPYAIDSMTIDQNAIESYSRSQATCESSLTCTYGGAPNNTSNGGSMCGCGTTCNPTGNGCSKADLNHHNDATQPDPNLLQLGMCSMMR